MATSLPSPPLSRSSTPGSEQQKDLVTDTLSQRLDALLEQYLHLLHQYTTLREELSNSFSSAFFTLAHAQRASTLGAGRRYGQEYYDDRMKAQRLVKVDNDAPRHGLVWKVSRKVAPTRDGADAGPNTEKDNVDLQSREKEDDVSQEVKGQTKDAPEVEEDSTNEREKQDPATRDPINWFGILAPSALRQSQSHFTRLVENQIPDLLSIDSNMRRVEGQIWLLREELGLTHDYEQSETKEEVEHDGLEGEEAQVKQRAKQAFRNLPSRPAHPKSHLLKLGE
ncbi:hypothetical protein LTR70_003887 [Exophiala xenobiotica]|uniref:Vacuolar ATPase assembly protein VMA22 n=1 Tax=Lithohypha guttulata TaxID=1690604 RepID=A0ABR0KGW0_9EURO|nr:hypothetical protein LTR24_003423 [Lithohypha guttulata]KAK5322206.1 hypothetical protein LTR70_003887 [Exophiala xenobiotica]